MISEAQVAVTPAGSPVVVVFIPVAPVVAIVISVKAVLIHKEGLLLAVAEVFAAVTVIVPVAFTLPQPPVKGIL